MNRKLRTWQVCPLLLCAAAFLRAEPIRLPAGSSLEIRLETPLASYSSQVGDRVSALLVAPLTEGDRVIVPQGAVVGGRVTAVRKVGLAVRRESARITIAFDSIVLPGMLTVPLEARVAELENARERVTPTGEIRGIDAAATPAMRTNNLLASLVQFEPIAYLYINIASSRLLHFAEPEIYLPPGCELKIKLTAPTDVPSASYPLPPRLAEREHDVARLNALIKGLPWRTRTVGGDRASDISNVVLIGEPAAVERAFHAAGWVNSDRLTASTGFLTLRSVAAGDQYVHAPMSKQLLDGQPSLFNFSKTLNTFSKRHHVRVFSSSSQWGGQPVFVGAATRDIAIGFAKGRARPVHEIETAIDNERTKIVNDLVFTGCVISAQLTPRPWVPREIRNATGELLTTDTEVAVLRLNSCSEPEHPADLTAPPAIPVTASPAGRSVRQVVMTVRNDLFRANLPYQGYTGLRFAYRQLVDKALPAEALVAAMAGRQTSVSENSPTDDRAEATGSGFLSRVSATDPVARTNDTGGPRFELGIQRGTVSDRFGSGSSFFTSLTLQSTRYLATEIGFAYQRGLSTVASGPVRYQNSLITRQFDYNLVAHLRPPASRLRPYLVTGPAFQMVNLTSTRYRNADGLFRVGLQNLGLLVSAYDFGSTPLMRGGGNFQFGLQYGAGAKYRLSRKWLMQGDLRETITPHLAGFHNVSGALRQRRASLGVSFQF